MAYRTNAARFGLGLLLALAGMGLHAPQARAEEPAAPAAPPGGPQAPQAMPAKLTAAQLQELVGPVALYPDVVLASLLPATAYPLQIVSAARWLRAQPQGQPVEAPATAGWDVNVKALLQLPDVLYWLDENIEWVGQVGDAMATQHADVLAAVQAFRAQAEQAGNLKSDDKVKVGKQATPPGGGAQPLPGDATPPIVIEPADPRVIYIPTYDPSVVVVRACDPCVSWGLGYAFGVGTYWIGSSIAWPWYVGGAWSYGGIWAYPSPWYWGPGYYGGWGYGYGAAWRPPYYHHHHGYGYGAVHYAGVRRPTAASWHTTSASGIRVPGGSSLRSGGALPGATAGRPLGAGTAGTRVPGAAGVGQPLIRTGQTVREGPRTGGLGVAGTRTTGQTFVQPRRGAPNLGTTSGGVRYAPSTTPWRAGPQRTPGTFAAPYRSYSGSMPSRTYSGSMPSRSYIGGNPGVRSYGSAFSGGGYRSGGYAGSGAGSFGGRSMGGFSYGGGGSRSGGGGARGVRSR